MAASLADLVVNISTNIASLHTGMNEASNLVSRSAARMADSVQGVNDRINGIATAFKTLATVAVAGLSIKGLADIVTGAIEAQAHLQDLADKAGTTASALSSLTPAAKLSSTSLDDVATASAKFSKNLIDVQAGTGKAAEAFKALGFNAQDAARFLKDPTQGVFELGKRLNEFATDGNKTAVVLELLGKSGANLIPFLKQLGEQTELTARVTDQQAAAAKRLQDEYETLKLRTDDLKNSIAAALVPELSRLLKAFSDATSGPKGLAAQIKELAADGSLVIWVQATAIGLVTVAETFITLGKAVYAFAGSINVVANDILVASLANQVVQGNLAAVGQLKEAWKQRDKDLADANERWSSLWNDNKTTLSDSLKAQLADMEAFRVAFNKTLSLQAQAVRDFSANADARDLRLAGGATAKPSVNTSGITGGAAGINQFQSALEALRKQAAAAGAELDQLFSGEKFTEAQKYLAQLKSTDVWKTFTAGQRAAIEAQTKLTDAQQLALESGKQLLKFVADFADAFDDLILAQRKEGQALQAQLDHLRLYGTELKATSVAQAEFELNEGKLAAGLLAIALVAPQAAEAMRAFALAPAAANDALRTGIDLEKKYIDAVKNANDALVSGVRSIDDAIKAERDRAASIGLTRAEIIDLAIAQELANDVTRTSLEIDQATVKSQELRLQKLRELRGLVANNDYLENARKGWTDLFNSIADRGAQFIEDFVSHGSSAFRNLWDDFKKWALSALAKIAAQQIIVSVTGALGLTGASGAAASALGGGNPLSQLFGGGGGSLLGQLPFVAGAGPLAGTGTGLAGYLAGAGFDTFASVVAGAGAPIATFSTALTSGAAAAGGFAAIVGAALPVIGLAIPLLAGLFSHKGGGPKQEGFATTGIDVSTQQIIEGVSERLYRGTELDSKLAESVKGLSTSFLQAALALGVRTGQAQFALGFSTDPQGTAPSNVAAGAFVNGAQVYGSQYDVGRDPKELEAALGLEAKRAIFAALQASDMPTYLANLFDGLDVAGASAEQIDNIIATAQALKLAVDTVSGLGDKFAALDPTQIQNLVAAFGGIQQFAASFQFINANFTTSAERAEQAQAALAKGFDDISVAIPATHQAFLDLLGSFDLTTESGRTLYAQVSQLAPLFVQVAGTADQAAEALARQVESAQQFFNENFFSDAEKQAQKLADDMQQLAAAEAALGISIPQTISGFRDLIGSIDQSTDAGKALYAALIVLAPAVFELGTAATAAAQRVSDAVQQITVSVGGLIKTGADAASTLLGQINSLASASIGDFGAKLSLQIGLIQGSIESANRADFTSSTSFNTYIGKLRASATELSGELARFTILSAQYDASKAEQLVGLEHWYAEQRKIFASSIDSQIAGLESQKAAFQRFADLGSKTALASIKAIDDQIAALNTSTPALAALQTIFQQKWDAIINGAAAAAASLDEFIKSIQGLANATQGNAGQQAGIELALSSAKVNTLQSQYATLDPTSVLAKAILADISKLQTYNAGLATQITHFALYTAEFGKEAANQLVELENWYADQQNALAGNTDALAILAAIFNEKRQAIIDSLKGIGDALDEFILRLQGIADATRGNAGQQAGIELALSGVKVNELQTQYDALDPTSALAKSILADITKLKTYNDSLATQIAHFTVYTAQYGVAGANQLVELENWYAAQQKIITDAGGGADALAILAQIFDDQWKAIVDGLKDGVDGSLAELARLKQGIADYLKGLVVSDISPLTPREKLDTARTSLDAEIALAQGGNTKALGDVTQYLDTFLKLDRDFNKSNDTFVADFNKYTQILGDIAGVQPTGQPIPTSAADVNAVLASALPTNGTLASSTDIVALGDKIAVAVNLPDTTIALAPSVVTLTTDVSAVEGIAKALSDLAAVVTDLGQVLVGMPTVIADALTAAISLLTLTVKADVTQQPVESVAAAPTLFATLDATPISDAISTSLAGLAASISAALSVVEIPSPTVNVNVAAPAPDVSGLSDAFTKAIEGLSSAATNALRLLSASITQALAANVVSAPSIAPIAPEPLTIESIAKTTAITETINAPQVFDAAAISTSIIVAIDRLSVTLSLAVTDALTVLGGTVRDAIAALSAPAITLPEPIPPTTVDTSNALTDFSAAAASAVAKAVDANAVIRRALAELPVVVANAVGQVLLGLPAAVGQAVSIAMSGLQTSIVNQSTDNSLTGAVSTLNQAIDNSSQNTVLTRIDNSVQNLTTTVSTLTQAIDNSIQALTTAITNINTASTSNRIDNSSASTSNVLQQVSNVANTLTEIAHTLNDFTSAVSSSVINQSDYQTNIVNQYKASEPIAPQVTDYLSRLSLSAASGASTTDSTTPPANAVSQALLGLPEAIADTVATAMALLSTALTATVKQALGELTISVTPTTPSAAVAPVTPTIAQTIIAAAVPTPVSPTIDVRQALDGLSTAVVAAVAEATGLALSGLALSLSDAISLALKDISSAVAAVNKFDVPVSVAQSTTSTINNVDNSVQTALNTVSNSVQALTTIANETLQQSIDNSVQSSTTTSNQIDNSNVANTLTEIAHTLNEFTNAVSSSVINQTEHQTTSIVNQYTAAESIVPQVAVYLADLTAAVADAVSKVGLIVSLPPAETVVPPPASIVTIDATQALANLSALVAAALSNLDVSVVVESPATPDINVDLTEFSIAVNGALDSLSAAVTQSLDVVATVVSETLTALSASVSVIPPPLIAPELTAPNVQPIPTTSAEVNAAIASALPVGSTIASSQDVKLLGDRIDRLIAALADANTEDSVAEQETLRSSVREIANALSGPELP